MRTYGRVLADPLYPEGPKKWIVVETDANGFNDHVYVTTLIQNVKLNLGESPFWAGHGLPARDSVLQQFAPDLYITRMQGYFAQFFATLMVSRRETFTPTYDINVTTHHGVRIVASVAIPE